MRPYRVLRLRLRSVFARRRVDGDLDEELRGHIERQVEFHRAAGMPEAQAREAALRAFGSVSLARDGCRDQRGVGAVDDLVRDAAYALRSMRRAPAHTAVAVLSLACAIGANTAIFSVVNALMLRSLPVLDPGSLVEIGRETSSGPGNFSYPLYERVRDQSASFSGLLAVSSTTMTAEAIDADRPPVGRFVSGDFFDVLGVRPALGRLITPADNRPGSPEGAAVAVIAYGLWQRRFGGSTAALGQTLRVPVGTRAAAFAIVGVLPQAFEGLIVGRPDDFYVPLASQPLVGPRNLLNADTAGWLKVVGRMQSGVSMEAARADLDVIYARYVGDIAPFLKEGLARGMRASRLVMDSARAGLSGPRRQFGTPVLLLMGAVTLVLLIACANLVNLLLARALARRKEIAVRLAVGASRARILRQLLTESAILGMIGGAAGLALAVWGTRRLAAFMANDDPAAVFDLALDVRVLAFTASISVASALLSGLIPACRISAPARPSLRDEARPERVSRGMTVWSRALIASQVALSLLLLAGALLLITTLRNLRTFDFGFERQHVLTMRLEPGRAGYTGDRRLEYFRQVLEDARRTPGVRAAALSLGMPVIGAGIDTSFTVEGQAAGTEASVFVNDVSDGYFATTGTPLLLGRDFGASDRPDSTPVAIVNDALVQRYFGGQNPIGRRIRTGMRGGMEIVGVVATTKYQSLREADSPIVYAHALQSGNTSGLTLSLKMDADPAPHATSIRQKIAALSPVPVGQGSTLAAQIDRTLVIERLTARVLGAFAVLALLLASAGLYAVLAYTVTRQTSEIGVRLALGATRPAVLWGVLGQASRLVALGVAIGIPAALALTRLLSGLLYGVTPGDGRVLAGVVLCLVAASLAAAFFPAWRASTVDPLAALRHE